MNSATSSIPDRSAGKPSNWPKSVRMRALALATNPELNLREVAETVGVPHATVRTWVRAERLKHKAREALTLHGEGLADSGAEALPNHNTGDAA